MDRREQRFQKRTAVTKEESPASQPQLTPQAKAQQTYQHFFSTTFVAAMTNLTARRYNARTSSGVVRSCRTAAPRNRDAHHARLCSEGSLRSLPTRSSPMRKTAKYALLTSARTEVPDRAAHVESSDSTHHLNPPLFAPVSRCVRSYR